MDQVAEAILKAHPEERVFGFYGEMGAGKTTLIKALCRSLGVRDVTSSPTFAIINEYWTEAGEPLYHFDFYRITKPEEALDIGLYDYLDSGYTCIIEWPENIEDLLPEETLRVSITVGDDESRTLHWETL